MPEITLERVASVFGRSGYRLGHELIPLSEVHDLAYLLRSE